ncbi:hypothetical protein MTR_0535s0060 [Medicago truncatula]|uniref:Uncharacterized protein n=1 Tax=Medicago truncatula TaxID=3880 RepID=A0A072TEL3_MEDTR|nr:hypothetical protein MTR_0535s0060 [Medicago truncatula]
MASVGSATFPVTSACLNTSTVNGRKSSFFEFKLQDRNMVIDVGNALINVTCGGGRKEKMARDDKR